MADSRFVCAITIRTTAEKLWQALLEPEFTRQLWVGTWQDCDWKVGSPWSSKRIDGVSSGWPHLLSSLESLLETGESFVASRTWPQGM